MSEFRLTLINNSKSPFDLWWKVTSVGCGERLNQVNHQGVTRLNEPTIGVNCILILLRMQETSQQSLNVVYQTRTITIVVDSICFMASVFDEAINKFSIPEETREKFAFFSREAKPRYLSNERTVQYFRFPNNV